MGMDVDRAGHDDAARKVILEIDFCPWRGYGDDTTVVARSVHAHAKKLKGALALVGGVFENAPDLVAFLRAL